MADAIEKFSEDDGDRIARSGQRVHDMWTWIRHR
jgi:hypothetical protein